MEAFVNAFGGAVERIASAVGKVVCSNLPAYIDLETSDGPTTLVASSGAIISGIKINGARSAVGSDEFERGVTLISGAVSSFLASEARTIDFFLAADVDEAARRVREQSDALEAQCEAIGLEAGDIIKSNAEALMQYATAEEVYLVLWTRPSILAPSERTQGYKDLAAAAALAPPVHHSKQDPVAAIPAVRTAHEAAVEEVLHRISDAGISAELLSAHEMVEIARRTLFPDLTPPGWKAQLPGDSIPTVTAVGTLRDPEAGGLDYSDLLAPSLKRQVLAGDGERVSRRAVALGHRLYAPILVDVPPKDLVPFNSLYERLAATRVPWRVMFRLDGGGLRYLGAKSMIARTFWLGSKVNQRIISALDLLEKEELSGVTAARLRIATCTWAPLGQDDLLLRRASRLASAVASWGEASVAEVCGDVMAGVISSVPFASETHIGPAGAGPIAKIARMLPLFRPGSPWKAGSMAYRTRDGKLMPFEPGSSLQATWNYCFIGRPGFGKTVQMMNLLLSSCLKMGARRLPRISILDIGPSSSFFCEMLKGSLAPHQRHQVQSRKLRMDPESSINVFDTALGARFPTPEQKAFLVNVITQIATPAEAREPYMRMSEMVSAVIDDRYAFFSDVGARSQPKGYTYGVEPAVDLVLGQYGIGESGTDRITWWQVTDYLAERGHMREAGLAQRNAVPVLSDLTSLGQSIIDIYSNIEIDGRQSLADAFSSLIQAAVNDFPNLSCPTQIDFGEARIVSIDLSEVAKSNSSAAERRTEVMYMVAAYAMSHDYRFDEDNVKAMGLPPVYHAYHMGRVSAAKEEIKWIVLDEYHRTKNSRSVTSMVENDQREGRKFGIGVVLSSQSIRDYSDLIRSLQTGFFIVDNGGAENLAELKNLLGLNDTAVDLLAREVTGPKRSGAPLLAKLSTKSGDFTQLLVSTMGPVALWGLSTTMEDGQVRRRICDRLGSVAGRAALAEVYPSGGVKDVVDALRQEGNSDPYDEVIKTVMTRLSTRQAMAGV